MGMWAKVKDFLAGNDLDDDYDDVGASDEPRKNVVLFPESKSGRCRGVSIFHPRRFDEVTEIADNLRAARHIVVNLVGADRALCQRIVDFLSGVVYTVDGKMQRLGEGIYLFVPANVPVTAHDNEMAAAAGYEGY
ncbi:MAG: cell division protein SepF [Candidatus Eremiobacteraeota bacterium]|nr:cell division protein SepF [Candidatus Eremiobacteraeota bacterium]MBV8205062.1 cell division protein SepF [Candidatus Eremiobacteraeota bacterium]MBV8668876.1 cell division protein SepF [Candidatus Eremiobacteraeota bacterium]